MIFGVVFSKMQTPDRKKQVSKKVEQLKSRIDKEVKRKDSQDKILATLKAVDAKANAEAEYYHKDEDAAEEMLQHLAVVDSLLDKKKEWDILKSLPNKG